MLSCIITIVILVCISIYLYVSFRYERCERKAWDQYSSEIEKIHKAKEVLLRDQLSKAVKDCINLKNKYRWKNISIETPLNKVETYLVTDGVFVFTATWKFLRTDENTKKEIWCWETNTNFYNSKMTSDILYWTTLNPFTKGATDYE